MTRQMEYKADIWKIDDTGERAILVVDELGLPNDQISRYVLGKQKSLATKTILNLANNICQLYRWAGKLNIDIENRIRTGAIFNLTEIDSLVHYLSLNQRQVKIKESGMDKKVTQFAGYVSASMLDQKIDAVRGYFTWLGKLAVEGRLITDPYYSAIAPAIRDLNEQLNERKVDGRSIPRMGLTEIEQQFLLEVTHPNNPDNPFQSRTRERNHLIIKLLLLCGVRLGELLSLQSRNCYLVGDEPYILFGHNTTKQDDNRKLPPEAKTLPRKIYLTTELAVDVDHYITVVRKARGREARKAPPYVFLNTLKKPTPMTGGALYHMCITLRETFPRKLKNLFPHRLRHTFNDNLILMFSDGVDDEEFKKIARWLNGWSDSSEEGKTYTHRSREMMGQRWLKRLHQNVMSGDYQKVDPKSPEIPYDENIDM
jgi:integrase